MGSLKEIKIKKINEYKTEFVSLAAHQLRTPLTAVKWIIKMILDGDEGTLNNEQQNLLNKVYKSNERMIRLINNLLDVSKIEAGGLEYEFKKVDIGYILDIVIQEEKENIAQHNIKFNLEKSEKIPQVYVDTEKIIIVFQNLLDNAIKYTPNYGSVKVKIENIKNNLLSIEIKDSGIGIPLTDQKKLFSKFFRASSAIKMETEGSGLGLFIAKNIIEKHGGQISISSKEGKGTKVCFTLPVNKF